MIYILHGLNFHYIVDIYMCVCVCRLYILYIWTTSIYIIFLLYIQHRYEIYDSFIICILLYIKHLFHMYIT